MSTRPHRLPLVPLGRAVLDRAAERRADLDDLGELLADPDTRVLEVVDSHCPVLDTQEGPRLQLRAGRPGDSARLPVFLGVDDERHAVVALVGVMSEVVTPAVETPDAAPWRTLREVGQHLPDAEVALMTTALALHHWHGTHGHCPRCGHPTVPARGGWVRRCERDGSEHHPRTDPAVIMAVVDDADRLLLARNVGWPQGRFSVLAGFVEPGETLAQAVEREVLEEVGVRVTDVQHVGDQPWPFPNSLMFGHTARALGADLTLQEDEIAEAMWVARDDVPRLVEQGIWIPTRSRLSISTHLMEHWYGGPLLP